MSFRCRPLTLAAAALATACSAAPAGPGEPLGTTAEPIIDGVASGASQNFVVLVVHPVSDTEAYECSGTLLTPRLVLTARHCVTQTADFGFSCDSSGNGSSGGAIGADFAPSSLQIFTGTTRPDPSANPAATGVKLYHDNATNLCNHDLALIGLGVAIPGADIAQIRLASKVTGGEKLTSVGWGVTATTASPETRQQLAGVSIIAVGPHTDPTNGDDVAPNEFEVGQSICQGDSGGPGLDGQTGAVVGVVSRGGNGATPDPNNPASTCESSAGLPALNYYTQTTAFANMIRAACADVGEDPWVEGGPDPRLAPFGGACMQGSDCQSNLCFASGSSSSGTCTQDCSSTACPSGYTCATTGGSQVCVEPSNTSGGGGGKSSKGCAVAGGAVDGGACAGWGWMALSTGVAMAGRRRRHTATAAAAPSRASTRRAPKRSRCPDTTLRRR
jgi:trypsin